VAFNAPKAAMGRQAETLMDTGVWVLPNPSGLNAHYTADTLAEAFAELRAAAEADASETS
jgi:TDG/mug DNA glycosylase family protein